MTLKFLQNARNNKLLIIFCLWTIILFITTVALAQVNATLKRQKISTQHNVTKFEHYGLQGPDEEKMTKSSNKDDEIKVNYRLPRNVVPQHYDLLLAPNIFSKRFEGSVAIRIQVLNEIKQITLHSNNLIINSVSVENVIKNDRNQDVKVAAIETPTDKREFLHVKLNSEIQQGNYTLQIKFKGLLDRGLTGFYASSLKSGGTMVASKFQPTYARQAFPCFDEPDFKATYNITLVKPPSYVALSNMNEISTIFDKETNTESVSFARSVPMSTYLACFVICDFDFKQAEINANNIGSNFKLRTFAQKNQMHKIEFALDIGKRATEFYIQYYEVPFPLPKLDMIAIPDYASGATEHWGLITYRETAFLVDQATASSRNKIAVANTIAHELAHMWFGNLVTNKWWDDLWLNEGFASYMQVKALNAIQPSWTMLDQFLTKSLHTALTIDAKLSSHPIVQVVATPDQITAIFDAISYHKGASVLRMLEGFIGEENFRRGVSDYLTKYQFGNTITQDLLSSLEPYFQIDNPGLSLTHIMDTWTRQMGYPLLMVKKGAQPNTYVISQSRFLIDPHANYKNDSSFSYRWYIPITYKTDKGFNEKTLWFPDTADNVKLALKDDVMWLKINNNQVGYYRVNYPLEMWEQLIHQLKEKSEQLTISDRAHLLNDVFALADAQIVSYELAMNLTTYLEVEEDFVPWQTAASIFRVLDNRLRNSLAYDDLQKYVQKLVKPLYKKQSWEKKDMSVIEGLLRTKILALATHVQLADAEIKVRAMFLHWLNNHEDGKVSIEPDLRDFVYIYGMKSATMSEWEKLWQIYLKEEDVQELTKLRSALAAPRDTSILKRYLTLAWDEKNIRSQDYLTVVHQIAGNPSGTALVWDDVRARWPQLVERFSLNSRYLGNLVPGITSDFNTELKLKEMEAWFAQYPEAGAGETARRRALETVRDNIRWTNSNQDAVTAWLKSNLTTATTH